MCCFGDDAEPKAGADNIFGAFAPLEFLQQLWRAQRVWSGNRIGDCNIEPVAGPRQ